MAADRRRAPRREREPPRIVALAGGVGAARFLRGLVRVVDPAALTVIVNTGDDIERHGLHVSPDIDSVLYTLGGVADEQRGWGMRDETWRCLERLRTYGEETWFQLGDGDLATHIWRTSRLRRGEPLSRITAAQASASGVAARVLPMTDDRVTTRVTADDGAERHLQEWLVREACGPDLRAVRYAGVDRSRPAPGVLEALDDADAVVVCPSNPVISIGPILAVPGVRDAVAAAPQTVAVSPIVAGAALRGPAARMLAWQGVEVSPVGVTRLYGDIVQMMVLDAADAVHAPAVEALGCRAVVTDTVMSTVERSIALARAVVDALGFERPPAVAA